MVTIYDAQLPEEIASVAMLLDSGPEPLKQPRGGQSYGPASEPDRPLMETAVLMTRMIDLGMDSLLSMDVVK